MREGSGLTRRQVLRAVFASGAMTGGGALMTACGVASSKPSPASSAVAALPPPETRTIRVGQTAACDPWSWMCESYLRDEGFTDVNVWVDKGADLRTDYVHRLVTAVDAGEASVALAGLHTGCIELWARPGIATFTDLRGKTIAVGFKMDTGGTPSPNLFYGFWVSLFAHVGMQPTDATFVETRNNNTVPEQLTTGKADAVMTVAAQGPVLHATIGDRGHVILDAAIDKPWSQQVCCILEASADWVKAHPVAARRATRAVLRAIDETTRDPRAAAKAAIEKGLYATNPAVTEQVIVDVNKHAHVGWREFDAEDSFRFYALRLRDGGLIKKTPQQIVADGTDLAWFRQMQKELPP